MLNYIKAELYRTFNRKYFYFLTGILAVCALGFNILLKIGGSNGVCLIALMQVTVSKAVLLLPVVLLFIIIDMIASEEYKNGTLKNVISFGMQKDKLIIGKFITIIILAFIVEIITLFVLYASGTILFGIGDGFSKYAPIFISRLCLVAVPWIAIIALGLLLNNIMNNFNMFLYAYTAIFIVVPVVIRMLSLIFGRQIFMFNGFLITSLIMTFSDFNAGAGKMIIADALSLVYIIVFLVLNIKCFSKKDVK